jgi:hypothetical protein
VVLHDSSEDLDLVAEGVMHWLPDKVHGLVLETLFLVFVIKTCEDPCVHAHVC